MVDIDKVIKGLQNLREAIATDFIHEEDQAVGTIDDALALLKEQEAVEPHYNARTNWYECGACKFSMTSGMHCRGELIPAYKVGFCAKCGRKQEWE